MRNLLFVAMMILSYCSLKAQTFTQIIHYPFVVTSIKYDNEGNEYVLRQQGSLTMNGDTLQVFDTHYQNECGAIDFDFAPNGFVLQLSGQDSTQKVIRYDTVLNTIDTILEVQYTTPFSTNHRGGSIVYRDSVIYCSFGYGSTFNDAQNLSNYKGKLIEINLQDSTVGIIAYGLRNPFRFSIENDDCYIGDVGWNSFEEVNYINIATDTLENFGWPCYEGDFEHSDTCGVTVLPIFQYPHVGSQSIIGGCFFDGYWYWTDHYTGLGGKIDSSGNNTPVDTFPQYVTSMTIYPLNKNLRMSTWGGWIYEMAEDPLSIDEDIKEEGTDYEYLDSIRREREHQWWIEDMIYMYGDVYFDILGKRYIGLPNINGIFYSLWREKWVMIFEEKVIYATERA